jgi:hypothetical protein
VEKVLSTSGSQLMVTLREFDKFSTNGKGDDLKEKMLSLKTTVVKQDGDTATVKMADKDDAGKEPKEQQYVRVEGRWIPKDMADGWKAEIAKAKKTIEDSVTKNLSAYQVMQRKRRCLKPGEGGGRA